MNIFKSENQQTSFQQLFFVSLFLIAIGLGSCSKKAVQPISFAFYNVENLFDTIDDPQIRDNSYLPDSKIPWNTERYLHKLDNLSRVMSSIDSGSYPTIFGLCEVENVHVLRDLVNHSDLADAQYSILHKDSPDERGIDVAMLYQAKYYTPVRTQYLKLSFPTDPDNKTRDILYSKGVAAGRDTLHIFINHWTSRWGGQEETEPFRKYTGKFLRQVTDSILKAQPHANIIIAGDLNDNPDNSSIAEDLGAKALSDVLEGGSLYNLSMNKYKQGEGTLYYKSWDMFDQIIVSGNMLNPKKGVFVETTDQVIIKHDWMLYQPKKGPARPSRTAAREYYGGFSDHLPVFIRMHVN